MKIVWKCVHVPKKKEENKTMTQITTVFILCYMIMITFKDRQIFCASWSSLTMWIKVGTILPPLETSRPFKIEWKKNLMPSSLCLILEAGRCEQKSGLLKVRHYAKKLNGTCSQWMLGIITRCPFLKYTTNVYDMGLIVCN